MICHYNSSPAKFKSLQEKSQQKLSLVQADFSKPESIAKLWQDITVNRKIDIVVNSAGIEKEDVSLKQIQDNININYLSPRLICYYSIEHFLKHNIKGIIVNIGSRAGYRGLPKGYYTYADSKAALHKYSQDIARDNAAKGINVYVIAPGPVKGRMFEALKPAVKSQCLESLPTKKPVEISEIVTIVSLISEGKFPSGTGGVIDLMGASFCH